MQHIETLLNPAPIYHILKNVEKFAIIVPNNKIAEKVKLEMELFLKYLNINKKTDILYKNILQNSQFFDYEKFIEETSNLYKIFVEKSIPIVVLEALFKKIPTVKKDDYELFKIGDEIDTNTFPEKLINLGYKYEIPVEEKGTFQIKGGIVDIFIPYYENPIRIELFGDEIESIRFFDADFQTTIKELKSFKLISSINFDFSPENIKAFEDYLNNEYDNERISFDKKEDLIEFAYEKKINNQLIEFSPFFYKDPTTVFKMLKRRYPAIYLYDTNNAAHEIDQILDIEKKEIYYDLKTLKTLLDPNSKNNKKIFHISPLAPQPPKGGAVVKGGSPVLNSVEKKPSVLGSAKGHIYVELETKAKDMRANPTKAEEKLWDLIKNKKLGVKFRQQHVIDQFIVDFCSISNKLIIEVDGEVHNYQKDRDEERTKILESYDYKVIRFTNEEVLTTPEKVISQINQELAKKTPPLGGWGANLITLNSEINSPYRIILQEAKTYFRLSKLIEDNIKLGKKVVIFYVLEQRKQQIEKILSQFHMQSDKIIWKLGLLKDAFQTDDEIFLSDYLILGVYSPPASTKKMKNIISSFSDLNKGDYVVHTNYGIGKYVGIVSKKINDYITDFLEIDYANNDKLFLPVYNLSLLYKHSSSETTSKLDSFRSKAWENRKRRIKKSIERIAQELIELYAERMSAVGYSFSENDELYDAFASEFPYVLTTDQDKTINEINKDMEEIKPMDRLVCGDVGFGKTEVAMRAAFKAVADNKQVAILAPTTVLSFQHFLTFTKRFANFPIKVEFISSFKSAKDKKIIFEQLKQGKIDILIGTQSILGKKASFKNLGLLIIDEEHKFGVKDKEKLRKLKLNIDTLAMTATPIPRTLNFSLSGIRDLSIINTPPKNRKSVKTVVMKKNRAKLREAINFELERGGQIFYIHNRIGTIYQEADYLLELFPNIKLGIAHADLAKSKLEKIMMEFYDGKFDLLLSTNIIESGIDIPNANTMIIDRADNFGLASLYQLRGRVGRAEAQGYCILQLPKKGKITSIAERRLSVISRYTDLGSGFQIAMQDMEIRGAGTLLGFAQKGHVDEVGYETYMNFLKEALAELKGDKKSSINFKTELNTAFSALLPSTYIENEFTRLSFYKRLSNSIDEAEINEIADELRDRFGNFPPEVINFINLVKIKAIATEYKISKITISREVIYMILDDPDVLDLTNLMPFLTKYPNIKFGRKNDITVYGKFNDLKTALGYFEKIISELMVK